MHIEYITKSTKDTYHINNINQKQRRSYMCCRIQKGDLQFQQQHLNPTQLIFHLNLIEKNTDK